MRILFLAHFYPPEIGGAAARLHGLARWLASFDHRVTVVTGMPNYPSGVIPTEYWGKCYVSENIDGVDVLRTWVYASSHRSSLRRLANYFSFVFSSLVRVLLAGVKFDVIIASSPPLFIGISGWLLSWFLRAPWVFDIRDIWPDVAVEAGEYAANSLFTRWGHRLARFLYQRATHITPVTENKYLKILATGIPSRKVTVVPNGVDLDRLSASADIDWRAELGLLDRFVVVYAGLIGIAQGVEIIVEAASILRDNPDLHFLLVGNGVRRAEVIRRSEELALRNMSFLPSQPREHIPSILRAANVAWVPLVSEELTDAVPSKMLEAWACRKAVILSASGEAADLVRRSGGGIVIPPGQPNRLAEAILALKSSPDTLQSSGDSGYRFVKKNFARQKQARLMEQVLLNVIDRAA
jgi:glycosyltransferase involved in cell wall biosynthesis